MKFKLSNYIIVSNPFTEKNEDNSNVIVFSCRKAIGVKINQLIIEILQGDAFEQLPDHLFSLLMHYEIIVPKDQDEEDLVITQKYLFCKNLINYRHLKEIEYYGIAKIDTTENELTIDRSKESGIKLNLKEGKLNLKFMELLCSHLENAMGQNEKINVVLSIGKNDIHNFQDNSRIFEFLLNNKKINFKFRTEISDVTREDLEIEGQMLDYFLHKKMYLDFVPDVEEFSLITEKEKDNFSVYNLNTSSLECIFNNQFPFLEYKNLLQEAVNKKRNYYLPLPCTLSSLVQKDFEKFQSNFQKKIFLKYKINI